jgi:bifunctional DNA-binding transcriptional regulator/antitoxin component of YhaV-PrlF toxin-antitoxin module
LVRFETVMSTLTVTAKGQVTLRKDLLTHLGVRPGEKIIVEALPDGRIQARAARRRGQISDVFDTLKRPGGPSLSIDEINRITADSWANRRS